MKNIKQEYINSLKEDELKEETINKYIRDVDEFSYWLKENYKDAAEEEILISWAAANNKFVTKEITIAYKEYLREQYKLSTINNKIVTLNKFFKFIGKEDLTLKALKEQTQTLDNIFTQTDFNRVYRQAEQKGTRRDEIMLDLFFLTGIRVSEMENFTVEAVKQGYMTIDNKGKIRNVPITAALKKKANAYCSEFNIDQGPIILSKNKNPLDRTTVFRRIKWLSGQARVKKEKAYPHSIRHLFAKNWLQRNGNNILQLADILGHESLETTRIYTKLNIDETRKTME